MLAFAAFHRTAAVAIGTIVLSTAALGLATAPARASTTPVQGWQASVNRAIDRTVTLPASTSPDELREAVVALHFDEAGRFSDAAISRSSGSPAIDAEALRTARAMDLPPLPVSEARRTVQMHLFFGRDADLAERATRQLAAR